MTDLGTGIAALVGLLFVVLVLFGIFLLIRNFWLWYWGISAIQQLLRDQIAETRELRETVTLTNMALSQLSKNFKAQQQTTPLQTQLDVSTTNLQSPPPER